MDLPKSNIIEPFMEKLDSSSFNVLARRGHDQQSKNSHKSKKHERSSTNNNPGKHSEQHQEQQNLAQQQNGQRVLALAPFDLKSIVKMPRTPLHIGLKFPKDISLEQLQKIIKDFHKNETRTDVRTELPMDFEPQKSIFSFLYTMNTFKDPTVNLPGCPVASTPSISDDTASGLVWGCEAGNFCAVPNVSVPCLPGFYCPANTAQPTLCCKGYLCSSDTTTIEVCPEGFFCPIASTRALPCNFLSFCPRGTSAIEKYGLGAILLAFALVVMGIFSIKKQIFRAQRIRYRQRLRELGDDSDDMENERKRQDEAVGLAQSIFLEDQQKLMFGSRTRDHESGLDFAVSQRSLVLAAAAAGNMNVSTMTLPNAERSFDIRFEELGLTLPTGVDIIKKISGRLITGRTCAVMGPSGAGKTTFLSILAGKVPKTDGSIKVNGKEQTLSLWKKLIGFVPQEDVMLSELTVREILMHSAKMRQPVHMSNNEKRLKVLEVIQFLGIGHIMDNRIGDVETRGVSGGERKRVNIGMELVASPSILFLDEPTSGLDSATSLEVCKLLRQIAQEQFLTVAAVVHSPSPHAFNQFDDLLLLGAGGRAVYSGPRDEAAQYFESIGYPVPSDENPADFFISLAAGRVDKAQYAGYDSRIDGSERPSFQRQEDSRSNTPRERINELFVRWEQHCKNKALAKTLEKYAIRESETMVTVRLSNDGSRQGSPDMRDLIKRSRFYPDEQYELEAREKQLASSHERDCQVSIMAIHQPSRPQSPAHSVPMPNAEGSPMDNRDAVEVYKSTRQGLLTPIRMSLISWWADVCYWCKDVTDEFSHFLWSIKCKFTGEKDPVRQTPSFGSVFVLCFKRACLQNYRSQLEFLSDQALHLSCGLCVSFASKDMMYIPRQPAEICAMAPPSIQLSCATPIDDIRYVGMFMTLGVFFAGISVGACTFGDEKAVFWRDTSAGMPTLPYYLAKILADIPRIIVACYFVSTVVSRSMFGLTGTGMSLAWALVLSGTAPRLYMVMNGNGYTYVRWIWNVSAPRWAVEAFYLKEVQERNYNELKHNVLGDTYAFEDYEKAILYMVYIFLGWNAISFSLMKLLYRHKVK
ncbi:hypothetical protein BGZ54_009137 [Gamsiella multidivaricata]|nr:hypothetical protein BGZ54_009137 [Gamsiella multidivaricata]